MNDLLVGLLGVLLATNQVVAASNLLQQQTGVSVGLTDPNDPVEREYRQLLEADDAAQEEVDRWILDSQRAEAEGDALASTTLRARIKQRFEPVKRAYEAFLARQPAHARARLAYGSFLTDIGEEQAALVHLEKARDLDPANPAAWNNLGNWYGHNGSVSNALRCHAKAMELNPRQPVYYQNLATVVFMFPSDAAQFYGIPTDQVFEKSMSLYRKALELDPGNFELATDYAQSYYGAKPRKTGDPADDRRAEQKLADEALAAWRQAYKLAEEDRERQGVLIHCARIQINAGRFEEARKTLGAVTNETYAVNRRLLTKKLLERETQALGTNVPARPPAKP